MIRRIHATGASGPLCGYQGTIFTSTTYVNCGNCKRILDQFTFLDQSLPLHLLHDEAIKTPKRKLPRLSRAKNIPKAWRECEREWRALGHRPVTYIEEFGAIVVDTSGATADPET